MIDRDKVIQDAIARFPEEFGLRAFPGDKFRISAACSYLRDWDDPGSVMLYTHRLCEDGKWKAFAKGTESELRREVRPL
jgi:hypothetical protein